METNWKTGNGEEFSNEVRKNMHLNFFQYDIMLEGVNHEDNSELEDMYKTKNNPMRDKIKKFIQKQESKLDAIEQKMLFCIEHKFEHENNYLRFQREFIMKEIWELKEHFEEELE